MELKLVLILLRYFLEIIESTYPQVIGKVESIKSIVSVSTSHELSNKDIIKLTIEPNLSVGIGASTSIYVKRDPISDTILINPILFNSSQINTIEDTFAINPPPEVLLSSKFSTSLTL